MKSGPCDCSSRARSRPGSPRLRLWLAVLFQSPATTKKAPGLENQVHTTDAGGPRERATSFDQRILASAKPGPTIQSSWPPANARPGHSDFAHEELRAQTLAARRRA